MTSEKKIDFVLDKPKVKENLEYLNGNVKVVEVIN